MNALNVLKLFVIAKFLFVIVVMFCSLSLLCSALSGRSSLPMTPVFPGRHVASIGSLGGLFKPMASAQREPITWVWGPCRQ